MSADYRPVHRLTPLLRFWTLILALIAAFFFSFDWELLSRGWQRFGAGAWATLGVSGAVFLVLCAAIWLFSHAWWRATGYRLSGEEISLRRGVVNRSLRTARYDRIQAVDVVESLIARLFRLAAVRVETAGGDGSVIEIAYLRRTEAEELRAELLARSAGEQEAPDTPVPDALVPEIPIRRSLAAAALRTSTLGSAAAIAAVLLAPFGIATLIPVLIGLLPVVWRHIDRSWRFTARREGDVLHVSYGLADRRRQSIPLRRIHGVQIQQPPLWRLRDWWEVKVDVAGYGAESDHDTGTTVLLPVGSRGQALALAAVLGPLDRAGLDDHARPEGPTAPQFHSPARARWISPLDHRHQAVTVLEQAVIVHSGRFSRRMAVIAPAHIQELTLRRGPVQHLLGLCTVRLDLVAGPVRMAGEDLSPADGRRLLDQLRTRRLPGTYAPGKPSCRHAS